MKQVVVKKSDLPSISKDGTYIIRVRIITDDKNSSSYWTPIYTVSTPKFGDKFVKNALQASVYHNKIGQSTPANYNIYLSWHDPNSLGVYDVYTKWHSQKNGWTEWMLQTTTTDTNIAFNPPLFLVDSNDNTTYFDMYNVAVTRSNFHREYSPYLALFTTETAAGGGIPMI